MLTITKTLYIVLIEDQPADAALIVQTLEDAGLKLTWQRVQNEAQYLAALERNPDIILSDYILRQFDAFRALQVLRETQRDIPLIIVTSSLNEEVAVECIKQGAADYLLKDRLKRLGSAVQQALKEKQLREDASQSEAILRASEARYRQMFEHTQAPQMLVDPLTATVADANPAACRFYGYEYDVLLGKPIAAISPLSPEQMLNAQQAAYFVFQHRLASGELRDVEIYSSPVDVQGLDLLYWIIHDITERKRMEAELLQNELLHVELEKERELVHLKERFTSMVSHEFRTPLTIMRTSTYLLKTRHHQLTAEQRLEYLDDLSNQISYMSDLLNDVLIVSKARAGKTEFTPAPIDIPAFCEHLFNQLRQADGKQHRFSFTVDGDWGGVMMDERLLRHILVNLITNAIKYSPTGTTVRFAVYQEADDGIFVISDEGIGIPQEDQKRLFEPFHRASNAHHLEGTGLGLAIVSSSVITHKGTITCESREKQGTTFTVRLPLIFQSEVKR